MALAGPSQPYDYTEGASAIDINDAVVRARRNSSYSGDNGQGAMFDGPGQESIPTSMSRMSYTEHGMAGRRRSREWSRGRRKSEDSAGRTSRRMSADGEVSQTTDATRSDSEDEVEEDDEVAGHRGRRRRGSQSPTHNRSSVFENIANLFSRGPGERRASLSRRSSASSTRKSRRRSSDAGSEYALADGDEVNERWGYSSGEEDDETASDASHPFNSEIDYGSYPPSPSAGSRLPIFSPDPIFGDEVRIDMDIPQEPLNPPPPGPPSRQTIYVAEEDNTFRFVGYEVIIWRQLLWRGCCVATLGLVGLLGHWFPRVWLRCVVQEKAFKDIQHGCVVVESAHKDIALFPVKRLAYPYARSTVFPISPAEADGRPLLSSRPKANSDNSERQEILEDLHVVDYRYSRFALDIQTGLFSIIRDWRDPTWTGLQSIQNGLSQLVRHQRLTLFGPNIVDIEGKSTISLLVDEIIHPFYVFQVASIILWSLDDYYYYAFCIALISTLSVATTLIDYQEEMSRFSCGVMIYTDGGCMQRYRKPSPELRASLFPADMLLLSGDAIVNESMLTGESIPVSKNPANDDDIARWRDLKDPQGELAKSFVHAGTRVVRIRNALANDGTTGQPALGLVVRTGFNTTKGALVRSMLFPKPIGFKFYRDSIRFIGVLFCVATLGFCASAVQFVRLGIKWPVIVVRALDLITIVVPPALPATLSIGTNFAIGRLRKLGIFCISPTRVNVGGKVNAHSPEDGLDILGVRSLDRNAHRFGELIDNVHDLPSIHDRTSFLHALATCHSLKMVDGEIIGDPLDVKMFEFTKWTLEEGLVAGTGIIKGRSGSERPAALVQTVVRPPGSAQFRLEDALKTGAKHAHFLELGVIRTFEFVSSLRRMSVVVKRLRSTSMEIYVKGAPEVMVDICEKDSFPQDYDDLLSYYTRRGYRVIAIAGKSIEGLSWLKAQKMKREQAESNLHFLGLIIFENKLKLGTTSAIQTLRAAHLACRMITGDNPLTAVSVARECSLVSQAAHVFAPAFIHGNATTPMSKLEWSCMDDPSWKLDDYSLKPLPPPPHLTVAEHEVEYQDCALVVTGDVFRWMINHGPLETVQRMLVKTQIFARMSPDEKNEVVERLQALGYTVLMCGDGANDCAALKAADVGISLSEAEASVAAPFTSRTPDISCVIEVIKEGRAALVTSFSCFKYISYTLTSLLSFRLPFQVMGRTLPYSRIYPKRPTASLVSKKVLASLFGQIIITSGVQFWTFFWVRRQDWYLPPDADPYGNGAHLKATNFENSTLFLVSCFQYILVAAVFSIGPPYRKSMWTNGWLMASVTGLTLLNLLVLLQPPKPIRLILELMPLPFSGRAWLAVFALTNVLVSLAFEQWATQFISQVIGVLMNLHLEKRRYREGKAYKAVEGGMQR
ncbi:hypothetical protein DFH29DRAFT_903514 [Suillus ampliporus]|nr:hypothetical protein DFH29DRAFT_903514 [Suillus ampliporus]